MERAKKYSRKRDAILHCVQQTTEHPTADWVYHRLKPEFPDLSLATVYRNLAMFTAEGTIGSAGVFHGLERYDGNVAPHAHFVCRDCGAVVDLPEVEMPLAQQSVVAETIGGTVSSCSLHFSGLCGQCAEKHKCK